MCDGSETENECAYRARCLKLSELAGDQTVAEISAVCERYDDEALAQLLEPSEVKDEPVDEVVFKTRTWRGDEVAVCPRPTKKFAHVLVVVDAIAERFAANIDKKLVREGQGLKVGQLYVRFLPGIGGRQCVLYLFTGISPLGMWIARIQMSFNKARVTIKLNCSSAEHAVNWNPPAGVALRFWQDRRQMLSLSGVGPEHARETGRFISELYRAKQIGSKSDHARRFM